MGENSYKSMRATDMDQVIFAGSGNRPARNHAEVSMAIDNTDRTAPQVYNEHEQLEVARRIEREQGSTYRINGREVRARDVQILFADASTGARSPALVHQGRIGEIIQAKPEQRRRVLEEAAGISGLHARRHEAELRLRAAEQNLQRLEDVIGQLASQMDALKRQARQAIRYRNVSAQVRKQEAALFHLRWLNARTELDESDAARVTGLKEVAAATLAQTRSRPRRRKQRREGLPQLREAEASAGAALAAAGGRPRSARSRGSARQGTHRRTGAASRPARRRHHARAPARLRFRNLAGASHQRSRGLRRDLEAGESRRSDAGRRVEEADGVLAASEKNFGEMTGALADLTARRNALERAAREQTERLSRLEREVAAVVAEFAKIEADSRGFPDLAALSQRSRNRAGRR